MKKLVIATLLLGIIIGLGIFESVTAADYFKYLGDSLTELQQQVSQCDEGEVCTDVVDKLDTLKQEWKDKEVVFYLIYDNTVLNQLVESLELGEVYAKGGQNIDAAAALSTAIYKAQSLMRDAQPIPFNFL